MYRLCTVKIYFLINPVLLTKSVIDYIDINLIRNVRQERFMLSTVCQLSLQTLQYNEDSVLHHYCENHSKGCEVYCAVTSGAG